MRAEDRRAAFLDVAGDIVAESGMESLTMEGIAEKSGVSKALGYRYFENRDDVLIALFDRESEFMDAAFVDCLQGCETFEEKLRGILDAYLGLVGSRGQFVNTLMQSTLIQGRVEEHRQEREAQTVAFIADLIQEYYELPRKKALLAASVFLSGSQGLIGLWAVNPSRWSRRELSDTFVDLCIGGLDRVCTGKAKSAKKR